MTDQERGQNIIWFGVPNPSEYDVVGERVKLNPLPMRAVATGAILFYNGNQPTKQRCKLKPEYHAEHQQQLAEWWGIETPADAHRELESLVETGHRARFQPHLAQNESLWRYEFDKYEFLRGRPVTSIAAWDYCRIVNLAYWTRDVGLLDSDTAYDYFNTGALLAFERFNSWEELAVSFLAGRIMWNAEDVPGHEHMGRIAAYLLEAKHNVWKQCPWESYRSWR